MRNDAEQGAAYAEISRDIHDRSESGGEASYAGSATKLHPMLELRTAGTASRGLVNGGYFVCPFNANGGYFVWKL